MFNRKVLIPLSVFLLLFFTPGAIHAADKVKNIVVFFSYSSTLPAYQNILEGFNSARSVNNDEPVNLILEYLDIGRSENEDYARYLIDMYNRKFKEIKIDLFVAIGPGLNALLLKYGDEALKSVPMINMDVDIPGRTPFQALNVENGKEIILKYKFGNTIKEALSLFPANKNVYVIGGNSRLDLYFISLVRKSIKEFEQSCTFNFLSGLNIDSTIRFARKIPVNSIIIVPTYLQDAEKVPFSTPEVLSLLSKNAHAPVFTITDSYVKGEGGVGGYILCYTNVGKEIGRMAREVLNGKKASELVVNENNFYKHVYDWQQLKRWHLQYSKQIPPGSLFYNEDVSLFGLYKWYVLGVTLFLLTQTLLIINLFRLNKKQKVMSVKMLETEFMHRELIRADRLSKMSTLTASLSHELFQPLAAIRFTAQAGKRFIETGKLDMARASKMFDNILEDDIRATGIINSVKSLMKSETREKEIVNLNLLIQETVDLIRTDAEKQKIRVVLRFDSDPVCVFGDKIQIQQVLMNFIKNAMNAMEKSNPENRILQIVLELNRELATVSVCDSGPGIDSVLKEKLFRPFFTTKKDGFGIGLTLCRTIIEKHNGKIWAENIPAGGSRFSFSLQSVKNE
ncbi:MAG: ATP-binding protein [Bacteroidota bacterium]